MKLPPLTNCHTHIFIADDVPPLLARTFLPFPLYFIVHLGVIIAGYKLWLKLEDKIELFRRRKNKYKAIIFSHLILQFLYQIFIIWILFNLVYFLLDIFSWNPDSSIWIEAKLGELITFLESKSIVLSDLPVVVRYIFIISIFLLSRRANKIIWRILKFFIKPLKSLPGKETLHLIDRYLQIAAITKYAKQETAYQKMKKMYPPKSRFVVLPMDMEYMGSGQPKRRYLDQLANLNTLANRGSGVYDGMIPFVFVDPRRIRSERINPRKNSMPFFDFESKNGQIILKPSLIKKYLELDSNDSTSGKFKGIKIYPALGYFVFDEDLLPLWLYCVQRNIPITTHCVIGTIFYRGPLKSKYFKHDVFSKKEDKPMSMYASSNFHLQRNFTHPINYLVLLEEHYLKDWLQKCSSETQQLFGYNSEENTVERNLAALKINFAHFGGAEEWLKYLDRDRSESSQEVVENPDKGIDFMHKQDSDKTNPDNFRPYKPAWLWKDKNAEWYSILCSMMLQYDNVYSDISYILHENKIADLLYATLENPELAKKTLFGTDYYVVRNHKSEKEMLTELLSSLDATHFHQIAHLNPEKFLSIDL